MRDTILCLCDLTGVMARPWVEHGYQAVLVDPQHGCDHEDGAYLKLACTIEEAFDQISVLVRSGRLAFVAWVKFMPSSSSRRTYSARLASHISFLVGYSTPLNVQRCSPPRSSFRWLLVT